MIIKINIDCPDKEAIKEVAKVIKNGGVVVIPTDTVYGLTADPFNEKAMRKVYEVKGREEGKPLPILLGESHDAFSLVKPSETFWKLARAFWPGSLTIVENLSEKVPSHLSIWGSIGVRLPNCYFCRALAREVGGAIIGTSANISHMKSPVNVEEAYNMLKDKVDLYVDGGQARIGISSTVVSIINKEIKILREGAIKEEDIKRVLESE
ncbi:Sua5/YciO/YrdC/YwlC family protein [Caldisphaera lagunensis DSM 15908]|uniref:L-threonylcarbamoyladenylate synthase n=1 Tax=Caldisphaera lagunensis (strain DSM 15908 / JCM 11604 / ANMR 0165 / IC-154) TaxID=1056495 RepID=L0ACW2_CALLD|nr:L-threonylcarbamoyladenylate synthase [Caldisphaera lagunensis]AFZ70982.1 Sua5/YciO/YrdC/YwlC family protein [Caldisphaera lagunensis DSM 15908]